MIYNESGLNKIQVSSGLGASFPEVTYIDEDSIKKILELTNSIWKKEGFSIYNDDSEFDNWVRFHYSELSRYLNHLKAKKNNKRAKIDNIIHTSTTPQG